MKKILITLLTSLCCVITACDWLGGGDQKIAPLSPSFVQAVAIPDTVEYNGSTVMHWVTKNAQYVMVNNKKMGAKDSIKFENLTSTFTVTLIAYGEDLLTSIKIVTIPVDNVLAPKVAITFPTEAIPYGSKTSFSWKNEGYVSSVMIDGIVQKCDSFITPALYENKEYTLIVTGPGGIITQKVMITVGDWTTSKIGLLTSKPWKMKSVVYVTDGVIVAELILSEVQKSTSTIYTKDGREIESSLSGTITSYWEIEGDWFKLRSSPSDPPRVFLIEILNEDEFALSEEYIYDAKPSKRVTTLCH